MKKIISIILIAIFPVVLVMGVKVKAKGLTSGEYINLDSYNVYGESLNISINDTFQNELIFKNIETKKEITISTSKEIDNGISPLAMEEGEYYIYNKEGSILHSNEEIVQEYYTITRDQTNYKISFYTDDNGYLVYKKNLSELPEDVYDLVIDPGHGGDDVGAVGADGYTYEKNVNLQVSEYLKVLFTEAGYKVALTREDDTNPGCEGVANYCEDGRVDQVYETGAKIVLSIHNNTGGGSGFEIYDSTFSSHNLASLFVNELSQYFTVSTKETDLTQNGIYNPLYNAVDYYFMIRETGGIATQALSEDNTNTGSTIGAEGFILELEYMDNYSELQVLLDEGNQQLLAQLIFNAVDEYIYS